MRHIISLALLITCAFSWVKSNAQSIVILDCIQDSFVLCAPDPAFSLPDNNQLIVGAGTPGATTCSGHVRLPLHVADTCGIIIRYVVDLIPFDGNDTMRLQDTSDVLLDFNDEALLVLDSKLFGTSPINLNGISFNEACSDEPGGFHRILWTVMDGCGDLVVCNFLLRLEDCLSPIVSAVSVSSVVMPPGMDTSLVAKDFIASAVDDCSPENWMLHSFDSLIFTPTKTYTCETINDNGSNAFIEPMWSGDAGVDRDCNGTVSWNERNLTRSNTLIVFDLNGQCEPEDPFGKILSENLIPIEGVDVTFSTDSGGENIVVQTDEDGIYSNDLLNPLFDYIASGFKGGDDSVGVSTLDLIKIQKHLLGVEIFNSPYKYIAADANGTESVSAADLLELRKLILRINHQHPKNESWRFVPASFVFSDVNQPWPFDESIILTDSSNNDFVAVKIGDINGTVTNPPFDSDEDKTAFRLSEIVDPLVFEVGNQDFKRGEVVEIQFTSGSLKDAIGFQFTLQMNDLTLLDIYEGKINITRDQFAVHENAITYSWFDLKTISTGDTDVLFTVVVKATKEGTLKESLNINSTLTSAESYFQYNDAELISSVLLNINDIPETGQDENSAVQQLAIYESGHNEGSQVTENRSTQVNTQKRRTVSEHTVLSLFQNEPNPFKSETTIPFYISESGKVSLRVFDGLGREMYFSSREFPAGRNAFRVNLSTVNQYGLLYYAVEAGGMSEVRRMVVSPH